MPGFAIFVAVVAGMVALVAVYVAVSHRSTARDIAESPWVTCAGAGVAGGQRVRVTGLAEPVPGPDGPPIAPLSGTPAAWCSAKATRQRYSTDSNGHRRTDTITVAELRTGPFLVRDRTGVLLVDAGDKLTWHDLEPSLSRRQDGLPPGLYAAQRAAIDEQLGSRGLSDKWSGLGARLLAGDGGLYDVTESVVLPGTPVVVLGTVATRPDGWPVLTGNVLASTESVEEVAADSGHGERRAAIVAGVAFGVALITLLVGALM